MYIYILYTYYIIIYIYTVYIYSICIYMFFPSKSPYIYICDNELFETKRFVHGMLYTEAGSRIRVCPSAQQTDTCLFPKMVKQINRTTFEKKKT